MSAPRDPFDRRLAGARRRRRERVDARRELAETAVLVEVLERDLYAEVAHDAVEHDHPGDRRPPEVEVVGRRVVGLDLQRLVPDPGQGALGVRREASRRRRLRSIDEGAHPVGRVLLPVTAEVAGRAAPAALSLERIRRSFYPGDVAALVEPLPVDRDSCRVQLG
jgi:hypothetical protein